MAPCCYHILSNLLRKLNTGVSWILSSMFPRYSRYLLVPLLLLIGSASSARAECGDPNPIISRVLCNDGALRDLESDIQAKYKAALSTLPAGDRPFLEADQSGWLSMRRLICSKTTEPGSTDEDRRRCLLSHGTHQLDRLGAWPDRGKVTMLTDAPADRRACDLALDRSNLAWFEDIEWGMDRYEPLLPAGAIEPAWVPFNGSLHVKYARFDVLNEGVDRDVYSIENDPEWRSRFHWYAVVADGEEELMRERVTALAQDMVDQLSAFGSELQRDSVADFSHGQFYEVFGDERKPASLRSMLVDPTNTSFYRGDATNSRVLLLEGVAYVAAADLWTKTALFRIGKSGSLTALCRHDAVPSRGKANVEIVSTDFSCPSEEQAQPIAWEGDQWDMHAAIDLEEWGGRRMVARRQESAGARYANTRIHVGTQDDPSPPDQNSWQPLDGAIENHDSSELVLTESGPYILIDDWIPIRPDYMPLGKTYYRIVDNGLTEVCRVTSETIPPPGYATKS
jgi:hypothetical protein